MAPINKNSLKPRFPVSTGQQPLGEGPDKGVGTKKPATETKKVDGAKTDKASKSSEVQAKSSFAQAQGKMDDVTGRQAQKEPSKALSQSARIMSPHLLFQELPQEGPKSEPPTASKSGKTKESGGDDENWFAELLERPFVPSSSSAVNENACGPLLAKLPPGRKLPVGDVSYTHDDGKLKITGDVGKGEKPEQVTKKMGLGEGARFSVAFDAALVAEYPRFATREPQEMWIGLAAADNAAEMALKIDAGQKSPYDAAKMLRQHLPKANAIVATKTIMQQIEQMSGVATQVGTGDPAEKLVELEDKALNAKGSSLFEELIKETDRKSGARTAFDDLLDQPIGRQSASKKALPENDKAVVAKVEGREVTAGDIRDKAFRSQKAVAFQVEGFADAHGSDRTLTFQVEKRGKGLEWSFHGVAGGRDRIVNGDFTPEGIAKFQKAVDEQPRYDMIPYKSTFSRFSERLTDAALGGLDKDRLALEAEMGQRGGTPVSEIFPDLDLG